MASIERTNWRDERLSRRHREWGDINRMTDIDFLVIEYLDDGYPVAIIEYKNENCKPIPTNNYNLKALIRLGDRANLPFFVVRYDSLLTWFIVMPANNKAKSIFNQRKKLTEIEYVEFIHNIRGINCDSKLIKWLTDNIPSSRPWWKK